jgi:hypothetical protein
MGEPMYTIKPRGHAGARSPARHFLTNYLELLGVSCPAMYVFQ